MPNKRAGPPPSSFRSGEHTYERVHVHSRTEKGKRVLQIRALNAPSLSPSRLAAIARICTRAHTPTYLKKVPKLNVCCISNCAKFKLLENGRGCLFFLAALSACVHTLRRSLGKEGRGAWLQQELDRTAAMGEEGL